MFYISYFGFNIQPILWGISLAIYTVEMTTDLSNVPLPENGPTTDEVKEVVERVFNDECIHQIVEERAAITDEFIREGGSGENIADKNHLKLCNDYIKTTETWIEQKLEDTAKAQNFSHTNLTDFKYKQTLPLNDSEYDAIRKSWESKDMRVFPDEFRTSHRVKVEVVVSHIDNTDVDLRPFPDDIAVDDTPENS